MIDWTFQYAVEGKDDIVEEHCQKQLQQASDLNLAQWGNFGEDLDLDWAVS